MNKKICPFMSKYVFKDIKYDENGLHDVLCAEERCALWDKKSKECAFLAIPSIGRILGNSTI